MLAGHAHLVKDFSRLIKEGKLGHGYIFFGEERVGKRTFALSLARLLETGSFDETSAILADAMTVGPDENGSVGIERIREVRSFLSLRPARSDRRTVIIDRAERLTTEAVNALLKVAEEPPPSALVLVIARDLEELPLTLRSRLHKVYFSSVPEKSVKEWLMKREGLAAPEAERLARRSLGRPGLAWALLHDERTTHLAALAARFMDGRGTDRNEAKELVEDELFDFDAFLETLMRASLGAKRDPAWWHELLRLRRSAHSFNLNPRLQLLSLGRFLRS